VIFGAGTMESMFTIECDDDSVDSAALAAIADDALVIVSRRLAIDPASVAPIRVIVGNGRNSAVDREIRVGLRAAGQGYDWTDWFELLFSHELTHVLLRDAWATGPVLWWEGMPVHLGDDRVRTRLFGRSYHAYCRVLDELGVLLPLAPLVHASTFYRRRRDIRVDLQAGSFCGFLLDTFGPRPLRAFMTEYRPPSPAQPRLVLDPILRRHLGDDLEGLARAWVRSLRTHIDCDAALVARFRARSFGAEPDAAEHCDFCFAPVRDGHICGSAGAHG
jgi:hypothetical protein